MGKSFESWRDTILENVRATGPAPDGDWAPALLMLVGDEDLEILPLPDLMVSDEVWAHARGRLLPGLLIQRQARRYALIAQAWESQNMESARAGTTAVDPNRREVVRVDVAEAFKHESWLATIQRPVVGDATLGEWRKARSAGGPGIDPMRAALQSARRMN